MNTQTDTTFALPEDMKDWAQKHEELISQLDTLCHEVSFDESKAWETIARDASISWQEAHDYLEGIESHLKELTSPEKRPLGLIGSALGGEEVEHVQHEYADALAIFTVIDEELRQQERLHRLLSLSVAHHLKLKKALQLTSTAQNTTEALENLMAETNKVSLSDIFGSLGKKWVHPVMSVMSHLKLK